MAAELATGYISLSVKYASAMKQINADFDKVAKNAKTTGDKAGKQFSQGLQSSVKLDSSAGKKAGQDLADGVVSGAKSKFGSKGVLGDLAGKTGGAGKEAASNFVDGMGGPLAAIGSKAGPIGLALTAAAGLGLAAGGLLAKQVLAGVEHETRSRSFAAAVGLSPQQGAVAATVAGKAYANNYGASIADNLDVAKILIQSGQAAGANDPNLQHLIEQVQTVATVTGETAADVVRGASQMVKTGMAPTVAGAMDLITVASQKGLNINGDLIDTVNEYSTQWRKIGLTGPKAIGAINQLVRGGARDTDVAADALKEFSIRTIDGSKTTQDAYQSLGLDVDKTTAAIAAGGPAALQMSNTVISRLNAIKDPVERNRVGVELFGTQWEDLGGAVDKLDLSHAETELGNVEGAVQTASDTMSGSGNSIETAKRNIEVAVDNMQTGLANAFGPALTDLANWITGHQDDIQNFFIDIGHWAITGVDMALEAFGELTQGFGQFIKPFGDIQGAMLDFQGFQATIRGDHDTARELHAQAQEAYGWGEGLDDAGQAMRDFDPSNLHRKLDETRGDADEAKTAVGNLGTALGQLPTDTQVNVTANLDQATTELEKWVRNVTGMTPVGIPVSTAPQIAPGVPLGPTPHPGGRAGGGAIRGPGGPTSDIIPIWTSAGEHVFTAAEVNKMGGQAAVYAFRRGLHGKGFAGGGAITSEIQAVQQVAAQFGLSLISGQRNEAGSYHNSGQAGDFSNGSGNTPQMLAFAKYMASNFGASIQELIYSDPGFSQLIGGGKNVTGTGYYSAGTLSEHTNHVHIAVKPGALPALGTQSLMQPLSAGGGNVLAAQNRVATARGRVAEAEAKKRELEPGAKESQRIAAQNDLDEANRDLAEANADLAEATSSAAGDTEDALADNPYYKIAEGIKQLLPDFGGLADIGVEGMRGTLLPPGFSDPTQWKSVQSIGALLGFIGGITGGPGGSILGGIGSAITGSGSGLVSGIMGAIPQPFGDLAAEPGAPQPGEFPGAAIAPGAPYTGAGPLPGPPSYEGLASGTQIAIENFNEPVKGLMDKANWQSAADNVPHLNNARRFIS